MSKWLDAAKRLRPYIETAAQSLDDHMALAVPTLYPSWQAGAAYTAGYKLRYNGKLYRVLQAHTSQIDWEPSNAKTLFETIDETHAGTREDPIPYDGNMALQNGYYYMQNSVIYLCNRDTINPVYNTLADLVGIYVEAVI